MHTVLSQTSGPSLMDKLPIQMCLVSQSPPCLPLCPVLGQVESTDPGDTCGARHGSGIQVVGAGLWEKPAEGPWEKTCKCMCVFWPPKPQLSHALDAPLGHCGINKKATIDLTKLVNSVASRLLALG